MTISLTYYLDQFQIFYVLKYSIVYFFNEKKSTSQYCYFLSCTLCNYFNENNFSIIEINLIMLFREYSNICNVKCLEMKCTPTHRKS